MPLVVRLAGWSGLEVDGVAVADAGLGQLGRVALAFLVTERHRPVDRHELAEVLWGERLPATWESALRTHLTKLRRLLRSGGLPDGVLAARRSCYQLCLPDGVVVDVEAAAAGLHGARASLAGGDPDSARRQAGAAATVAGREFLPGAEGDWVEQRRAEVRRLRVAALEVLAQAETEAGDWATAVRAAEEALALEPLRESAYVRLMAAHAVAGSRGEALRAYSRCRQVLAEELGVDPSEVTQAAYIALLGEEDGEVPTPAGNRGSHHDRRALPLRSTSFVGRARELDMLEASLNRSRVLSLVGTGGSGKTRLALELADRLAGRYPAGVVFVALAGVEGPERVERELATAVFGREALGEMSNARAEPLVERLIRHFDRDPALVILDNCEHLLNASANLVTSLTSATAQATVLATSRERLGLEGEAVFTVPPLAVPAIGEMSVAGLLSTAAVQLFVDRARAVDPYFEVTEGNAGTIARLCRRLGGIPLALEIAAAQLQSASVQYLERLSDQSRLSAGTRDSDPRHRTMYATLEWSHDLLDVAEQALLRRLSVFAGGFTIEAAGSVCWTTTSQLATTEVARLIRCLVAKSMIAFDPSVGDGRYRLLEPVRQYAAEKLDESGETEAVRGCHVDWMTGLAMDLGRRLAAGAQEAGQFLVEHDNLEQALRWADCMDDSGALLRIVGSMGTYWVDADGVTGRRWVKRALERGQGASPSARAFVHLAAGKLYAHDSKHKYDAVRWLQEAAETFVSLRRPEPEAWTRYFLGRALFRSDPDAAKDQFTKALDFFRDRDAFGAGWCLQWLATMADNAGAAEHAEELWRSSIQIGRAAGTPAVFGNALSELAVRALWRREQDNARALAHEAVNIQRSSGDRWNLVNVLITAGHIDVSTGHRGVARAELHEALALGRTIRTREWQWQGPVLLTVAQLLAEEEQLAPAAQLLAVVNNDLSGEFTDRKYSRLHQDLCSRLGNGEIEHAVESVDEALGRALVLLEGP